MAPKHVITPHTFSPEKGLRTLEHGPGVGHHPFNPQKELSVLQHGLGAGRHIFSP